MLAVADATPRHRQPVAEVGYILGILALEFLILPGMRMSRSLRLQSR